MITKIIFGLLEKKVFHHFDQKPYTKQISNFGILQKDFDRIFIASFDRYLTFHLTQINDQRRPLNPLRSLLTLSHYFLTL